MPHDEVDYRPQLNVARGRMAALLTHIRSIDPSRFLFRASIIDRQNPGGWRQLDVQGYLRAVQQLEKHAAMLDAVCFSTIPYLRRPKLFRSC
jgi:hypothetical protein